MNLDALKKATDLNIIIDKLMKSSENVPEFSKECEKHAIGRIEIYTSKVTGRMGLALEELVEEHSRELMKCIQEISQIYYKNGMNAGAVLLMQLMGF